MGNERALHIGTSGWSYDHWSGPFYPETLSQEEHLPYYAEHFSTVEVNNSFYQLPTGETLARWRETTPDDFVFAVKASRYITHMKKLKDPEEPVNNFIERVQTLGKKLGPILFQLPPRWNLNAERLQAFLEQLPGAHRYTFEFRDPNWFDDRVYALLEEHGAAFCIYEFDRRLSPKKVTADFVYIRLHGPEAKYQGQYDAQQLAGWAGAISTWTSQGREVYCYFDNDQAGYAPQDAAQLQEMLIPDA